jgi:hypothetical protein
MRQQQLAENSGLYRSTIVKILLWGKNKLNNHILLINSLQG